MAKSASPVATRVALAEHNVPVVRTWSVGRRRELEAICETPRRTRLVTLPGPGGLGGLVGRWGLPGRATTRRSPGMPRARRRPCCPPSRRLAETRRGFAGGDGLVATQ